MLKRIKNENGDSTLWRILFLHVEKLMTAETLKCLWDQRRNFHPLLGIYYLLANIEPWDISPWVVMEDSTGVRGNSNFANFNITFVQVL